MSGKFYKQDYDEDDNWFTIAAKAVIIMLTLGIIIMLLMKLDSKADETKAALAETIKYSNRFNDTIVGTLESNNTFKSIDIFKIKTSVHGDKAALFLGDSDEYVKTQPYTLFVFGVGVGSNQQVNQQVNQTYAFRVIESTCSVELLWSVPAVEESSLMVDLKESIGGFCK